MDHNVFHKPPAEVLDHPLFSGSNSVGIIGHTPETKQHLETAGLKHEETHGSYGNGKEKSYIVHSPTREHMYEIGHKTGQDAVIYSQNGKHELLHTKGPHQGKFHPALPLTGFSHEAPDDYYTHLPGKGHVSLYFNHDQLHDSPVKDTVPQSRLITHDAPLSKSEFNQPRPWPGSHPGYDAHTSFHHKHLGGGLLLSQVQAASLMPLAKKEELVPQKKKEQEAPSYAHTSSPFGSLKPGQHTNLNFYNLGNSREKADQLVKDHGYTTHYYGGKSGKADLARKNLDTHHLPVLDSSMDSSGDVGHDNHVDAWRKTHQLAHALTQKDVNQKFGEGKRVGRLGRRTLREALRSVEWTSHAVHKQRQLAAQLGIHISDENFNKEHNVAMADSVHRALSGGHSNPVEESFHPHSHKVPLSTSLQMVKDHADKMGIK